MTNKIQTDQDNNIVAAIISYKADKDPDFYPACSDTITDASTGKPYRVWKRSF